MTFQRIWNAVVDALHRRFMLRWVLANMLGWTLALAGVLIGSRLGQWIGSAFACAPLIALLLAGALAGAAVGACQAWALRGTGEIRQFALWSALGGALGVLPVFLLSAALLLNVGVGGALIGAAYAGILAALQTRRFTGDFAPVWIIACVLSGSLCGALSTALPLIGPLVFGLITGWALLRFAQPDSANAGL